MVVKLYYFLIYVCVCSLQCFDAKRVIFYEQLAQQISILMI